MNTWEERMAQRARFREKDEEPLPAETVVFMDSFEHWAPDAAPARWDQTRSAKPADTESEAE